MALGDLYDKAAVMKSYKNRDELTLSAHELREEGMTYKEIAATLGVNSKQTIYQWINPHVCERGAAKRREKHKDAITAREATWNSGNVPGEQWRMVVGYEGLYDISDSGRTKRVGGGAGACPGRVLKPAEDRSGYLHLGLTEDGYSKNYFVHRLVAAAFIGPCPEGKQVNHKDGDKSNNCPSNLEYVTASENVRHAFDIGIKDALYCRGEKQHNSILTEKNVHEIRRLIAEKEFTQRKIAEMFGVGPKAISMVNTGKSWSWLK